jgi:hypothetical protein
MTLGTLFGVTPFKYVIQWDRLAAHMGMFPDTFQTFIQELGEQATKKTQTRKTIANTIREQTHRMFKLYWKLDRESKQTKMGEPENPNTTHG